MEMQYVNILIYHFCSAELWFYCTVQVVEKSAPFLLYPAQTFGICVLPWALRRQLRQSPAISKHAVNCKISP